MSPSCCLIANPASGRGRGARRLPALRDALGPGADVRITRRAGDERELARDAAAAGIPTIVALGGDGTWSNVARGLLDSGTDARLVLAAAGTGNDLAFNAGLDAADLDAVARIAAGSGERRIDVGSVAGIHFVNVCGFGFDAAVLASMHEVTRLRGPALYYYAALRKLFAYDGCAVTWRADEAASAGEQRHLVLVVSNGARFGGGFLINPAARLDDGLLDLCAIGDASPLRRLALFARALGGRHLAAPEVQVRSTRNLRITFREPPAIDVDGELHQAETREIDVACLPARLRLGVPN